MWGGGHFVTPAPVPRWLQVETLKPQCSRDPQYTGQARPQRASIPAGSSLRQDYGPVGAAGWACSPSGNQEEGGCWAAGSGAPGVGSRAAAPPRGACCPAGPLPPTGRDGLGPFPPLAGRLEACSQPLPSTLPQLAWPWEMKIQLHSRAGHSLAGHEGQRSRTHAPAPAEPP